MEIMNQNQSKRTKVQKYKKRKPEIVRKQGKIKKEYNQESNWDL